MDGLAALAGDVVGGIIILAKEVGKGGGGSTEEPTVCMALLPFALGIGYVAAESFRRKVAHFTSLRHRATA